MVLEAADSDFDLQNELNAILAGYHIVATVDSPDTLRYRGRSDTDSFACHVTGFVGPEVFREADAVLLVFQLAQQNYISNVHLCSQTKCLRFFYSSKRNQRFCSTTCRSDFWNATDRAKEARRVAAKNRRAREREEERKHWAELKSQGLRKQKRRTHR
jgi:hypothetical protein